MCVKSSNQRSGIGTKIVNALSQSLISQDINMLYLLTMRDSIAEAFYKKCGFNNSKMIVMSKTNLRSHFESKDCPI
jgi:N-acetylglutamate synthase-like GNAT family acetyltransferase